MTSKNFLDRETRNAILADLGEMYVRLERLVRKHGISADNGDLRWIFGALTSLTHTVRFLHHKQSVIRPPEEVPPGAGFDEP